MLCASMCACVSVCTSVVCVLVCGARMLAMYSCRRTHHEGDGA